MTIFSKIRSFLNRHRNKIVVGGIIVSGSILLTRYAQQKLREYQENQTKEFLERTRKQQHFESTERTCSQTVVNLMVSLIEALAKAVNTEEIIEELRKKPENKVELWEKLKVLVFTRITCLIYLTVMLVVTLRIQLNIIGGYLYRNPTSVSTEVQLKYLTLTQSLFNDGVQKIAALVEKEYVRILGPLQLNKELKLGDLENIFWSLQTAVATNDDNPLERFREFLIPGEIPDGNDVYSCMIRDTADLLDSDEVKSVATHCITRGFVVLGDQIAEYYVVPNGTKSDKMSLERFVHPVKMEILLAKLVPVINGLFSKKSLPNNLVQQLIANEKLKTLGANVYECFSSDK